MLHTRQALIDTLQTHLAHDPRVTAAWLEGADATGWLDAYSDIDFCVSVQEGMIEAVIRAAQAALETLGVLDLAQRSSAGPEFAQVVFHLAGTSPYLLVDFNAYVGCGSHFILDDPIEKPLVLFDHGPVVTFSPPMLDVATRMARLEELRQVVAQDLRIHKYVLRGDYLEAFGYYHKWLLTPLVEVLRMRYTPLHSDYYIVHISRHLPREVLARLETLFQITSLDDLNTKRIQARAFFEETASALEDEPQE